MNTNPTPRRGIVPAKLIRFLAIAIELRPFQQLRKQEIACTVFYTSGRGGKRTLFGYSGRGQAG
jgi:hypothetical protein